MYFHRLSLFWVYCMKEIALQELKLAQEVQKRKGNALVKNCIILWSYFFWMDFLLRFCLFSSIKQIQTTLERNSKNENSCPSSYPTFLDAIGKRNRMFHYENRGKLNSILTFFYLRLS